MTIFGIMLISYRPCHRSVNGEPWLALYHYIRSYASSLQLVKLLYSVEYNLGYSPTGGTLD